MKRFDTLTAFVLAASGLAAAVGGCELVASVDRSQISSSTGMGGSTTSTTDTTSETSTSSTGMMCAGGAMACSAPADCPMPTSECVDRTCDMGCCGTTNKADGVATTTQSTGDCNKTVCDGNGASKQVADDTDKPAGSDACHVGTCTSGVPGQDVATTGTACMLQGGGNGVCGDTNGGNKGKCVECNATADCTGTNVCDSSNACVSPTCTDNTQDGTETDKDCGGTSCSPCATGLKCKADGDCQSGNCNGTTCVAATCSDTKLDGSETDVDCGGATCDGQAKTCADNQKCLTNADCSNGFCDTAANPKVCKTPTCMDGVQNGTESDTDCGAACGSTKLCAVNLKCVSAADCQSGYCDGTKHCNTLPNGDKTCTTDNQCSNGHCVADGTGKHICCATACSGTCLACSNLLTGGTDGTCGDVKVNTAPAVAAQCATGTTCGNTGLCAAGHTCQEAATTVVCAGSSCMMGTSSYTFVGQSKCDGVGMCGSAPTGVDCGTFGCDSTNGCKTACTTVGSGAECAPNRTCTTGTPNACLLNNGQACAMGTDCASGNCVLADAGMGTCM